MFVQENASLRSFNTFGIPARARWLASFSDTDGLTDLLDRSEGKEKGSVAPLILGGGSNVLFTHDVDGWVMRNEIPGIDALEDGEEVLVSAGAGENWHGFVMHCLDKGWYGLENLSLIPGSVGASPMQNIGAYGVEIATVFDSLEAWDMEDRKVVRFYKGDCHFGYRESYFKKEGRGRFVILRVTYRLSRKAHLHTAYGAIKEELERMGVQDPGPRDVSNAVIHIRRSKLPDPNVTGNAGSFFKNPTVPPTQFDQLKQDHPEIVGYPSPDGGVKLAAGWMIERAGWKGFRRGDAGCHPKQALVLVNYGEATGKEIWQLSQDILDDVYRKFGVHLEREVNIY